MPRKAGAEDAPLPDSCSNPSRASSGVKWTRSAIRSHEPGAQDFGVLGVRRRLDERIANRYTIPRERTPRKGEYWLEWPARVQTSPLEREPAAALTGQALQPGAPLRWRLRSRPNSCPS